MSYLVDLWKKIWIPKFQARWRGKKSGAAWKFHDFLWKVVDFLRLKSGGGVACCSRQVKHLPGGKTAWEIPNIYIYNFVYSYIYIHVLPWLSFENVDLKIIEHFMIILWLNISYL